MALASSLRLLGFTETEVARRLALFAVTRSAAIETAAWYHVPGRIEVLGKHTDYAGGRSLVCATEQGMAVETAPRADCIVRIIDAVAREVREFPVDPGLAPRRGDWANYPMTVVSRLAQDFGAAVGGFDLAFASDIPIAAGVSSSSALVVAVGRAVIDLWHLDRTDAYRAQILSLEDVAGYLGAVENGRPFRGFGATGGVGTLGGSQDHTAILCSASDALTQVRFDPVVIETRAPWPGDFRFVIGSSGVVAEKAGRALEHYNGLARMTERLRSLVVGPDSRVTLGRAIIDQETAGVSLGADVDPADAPRLSRRLAQLTAECRVLIPGVVDALGKRADIMHRLLPRSRKRALCTVPTLSSPAKISSTFCATTMAAIARPMGEGSFSGMTRFIMRCRFSPGWGAGRGPPGSLGFGSRQAQKGTTT